MEAIAIKYMKNQSYQNKTVYFQTQIGLYCAHFLNWGCIAHICKLGHILFGLHLKSSCKVQLTLACFVFVASD